MSNKELNYAIISELRDQLEAKEQMIKELKADFKTLAQKLRQVKPELREWLEVNYKEYL